MTDRYDFLECGLTVFLGFLFQPQILPSRGGEEKPKRPKVIHNSSGFCHSCLAGVSVWGLATYRVGKLVIVAISANKSVLTGGKNVQIRMRQRGRLPISIFVRLFELLTNRELIPHFVLSWVNGCFS